MLLCHRIMKKALLIIGSVAAVIGLFLLPVLTKPYIIDFYNNLTQSESSHEPPASESASSSNEEEQLSAPQLTAITVAEPNNIGYSGYMEKTLVSGQKRYSVYKQVLDSYKLTPYVGEDGKTVVLDTGHQVYKKSAPDDSQLYVVSGVELLPVNDGWEIDTTSSVKLRKEGSGERIRVYTNEGEYNLACENYEKGQAILSGKEPVPENCVILNGMYLPSVQFETRDDGRIYLPMTQIAEAYDEQSEFYSVEGWLNVAVDFKYIVIPTNLTTQSVKEYFSVQNGTWTFSNEDYPMWSDAFYLPQTADTEMPLEDIARIFGWEISTGKNIVNIVTDELDNNNNFVLHKVDSTTTYYPVNELPESEVTQEASSIPDMSSSVPEGTS